MHSLCYPGCAGSVLEEYVTFTSSSLSNTDQIKVAENHLVDNVQYIPAAQFSLLCRNLHLLRPNVLKWFDRSKPTEKASAEEPTELEFPLDTEALTCFGGVTVFLEQKLQTTQAANSICSSFHLRVLDMPREAGVHSQVFYILFPSSGTTSGNGDPSGQTDNTALICQSNTILSTVKQLWFKSSHKPSNITRCAGKHKKQSSTVRGQPDSFKHKRFSIN